MDSPVSYSQDSGLKPDVAIAYAARCLIHLASLLSHAVDLRQVGKDVESLAKVIAQSMYHFQAQEWRTKRLIIGRGMNVSDQITHVVQKARNDHRLPPSFRIPSPAPEPSFVNDPTTSGLPIDNWLSGSDTAQTLFAGVHTGTFGGNGEFTWAQGWDFGLADELFSSVTDLGVGTEVIWNDWREFVGNADGRIACHSGS
jgi:hypothetical protein